MQGTYARILARPRVLRNDDDLGYLLRALLDSFVSGRPATARRPRAAGGEPEAPGRRDAQAGAEPPAEVGEVFSAIAALPAEFRDALVAIDVAGLSYGEAANGLRMGEVTLASCVFRARSRLAKSLSRAQIAKSGGRPAAIAWRLAETRVPRGPRWGWQAIRTHRKGLS